MSVLRVTSGAWVRRAIAAVAIVAAAGASGTGRAGDPLAVAQLYGAGVHAYFSGDYLRSYDDLTATIEAGSRDPRSRYFRGLAALSLGRLDEAEADFSQGALLEAEMGGDWSVSRSLERVQGHQRLQLEQHRARARNAMLTRARAMERDRYLQIHSAQPDVQRGRRPLGEPSRPGEPINPFAAESDAGSAPGERPAAPEPMPAPAEPEPAPEISGDDPFGDAAQQQPKMPVEPAGVGPKAGEPGGGEQPLPPGDSPSADDPFGDATQP